MLSPSVESGVLGEEKVVVNSIEAEENGIIDDWDIEILPGTTFHGTSDNHEDVNVDCEEPGKSLSNNDGPEHALLWEWLLDEREEPDTANEPVPPVASSSNPVPGLLGSPVPVLIPDPSISVPVRHNVHHRAKHSEYIDYHASIGEGFTKIFIIEIRIDVSHGCKFN